MYFSPLEWWRVIWGALCNNEIAFRDHGFRNNEHIVTSRQHFSFCFYLFIYIEV